MNPSYHRRAIFCYDPNEQPGSRIAPSNSTLGAGYADGTWVHSQIAVTGGMVLPNSSAEFTGWFVEPLRTWACGCWRRLFQRIV